MNAEYRSLINLARENKELKQMLRRCCESYRAIPNSAGTKALGVELSTFLGIDEWIDVVAKAGIDWPRDEI